MSRVTDEHEEEMVEVREAGGNPCFHDNFRAISEDTDECRDCGEYFPYAYPEADEYVPHPFRPYDTSNFEDWELALLS